jgi:hypothetical protein
VQIGQLVGLVVDAKDEAPVMPTAGLTAVLSCMFMTACRASTSEECTLSPSRCTKDSRIPCCYDFPWHEISFV